MAKNKDPKWDEYFAVPNPGLVSYFAKTREGNSDEYRTTFYKGRSLSSILKAWEPTLKPLGRDWPTLLDYENDLRAKVGPLSIQKPLKQRMKDIDHYYEDISKSSQPLKASALARVKREWNPVGRLELRTQRKTVDNMKKSTNSGNPYFTKRRAVVSKTIPVSLDIKAPEVVQQLTQSRWLSAAVLGWRGQEGGPTDEDVKQRVVWMFPFGVNVAEQQYYQLAIEQAQKFNLVPPWVGTEAVDQTITKLFDTKGRKDLIVCTDFTKFDQHFNQDMANAAQDIIRHTLNSTSTSNNWLSQVFPVKYMIPLAYDDGKIRRGRHGMASGSGGTNFDETIVHRALQYEAAQFRKSTLNPNSMCLGDDGILTYPGITVEDVTQVYSSHGQEMNLTKQYASAQDCTFLRKWHHKDYRVNGVCVGVYSTYRALGRLCEQERFYDPEVWGPKMVALRQLSIIENCKYHPKFEQFIEFCMKGDKYRLGIDIPGFLDDITSIAEDAIELMPDFLGYTKSLDDSTAGYGIADWAVVKYLKSKAR